MTTELIKEEALVDGGILAGDFFDPAAIADVPDVKCSLCRDTGVMKALEEDSQNYTYVKCWGINHLKDRNGTSGELAGKVLQAC